MAGWVHRAGGRRRVRADDELLRGRRREAPLMPRLLAVLVLACAAVATAASPPVFDGAAALRHVERLVALGPRPAGSDASARARAYIIGELKKVGVTGEARPFRAQTPQGPVAMANVVAVLKGQRPDVIMLAGHYDTKVFK